MNIVYIRQSCAYSTTRKRDIKLINDKNIASKITYISNLSL